jgi:hypothetical protein
VLFVKANRFLSKDSIKKEKSKIKNEIKSQFIIDGGKEGRVYMKSGELHHSDDSEEEIQPKKKLGTGKKTETSDDESSEYEDIENSSEEEEKIVVKRPKKEDPRNRVYLQHYRETVEAEQAEHYSDLRQKHIIDFKSPKGLKKIMEIEGLVRMIYKEQCISIEDL